MAKIGDIKIFVTEELPDFDNDSTDQPIEDEGKITDHVKTSADTLKVSGKMTGDNAGNDFSNLKKIRDRGEPVKYIGRNYFDKVIIESLSTEHDNRISNGFRFTMRLKQIKVAQPSPVETLPVEEKSQAKPPSNKGSQQPEDEESEIDPYPGLETPSDSGFLTITEQDIDEIGDYDPPTGTPQMQRFEDDSPDLPLKKNNFRDF